jgi:hypothetical protein
MKQHTLVMEYVRLYGSINPAKVKGTSFMGGFFGSETPKRCRELRANGSLASHPEGKYVIYTLPNFQSVTRDYKTDTAERKPMPTTPQTEAKWQQMGAYLKGKVKTNPVTPEYKDLTVEELKARKEKAEAWLQENQGHKNYSEALTRYERICDYLNLKENFL